jgi:HEAT repeat protein
MLARAPPPGGLPRILGHLRDPPPGSAAGARDRLVLLLAATRDASLVDAALPLLLDERPDVRRAALGLLEHLVGRGVVGRGPEVLARVIDLLGAEADAAVQRRALEYLSDLGGRVGGAPVPAVARLLDVPEADLRELAAGALGSLGASGEAGRLLAHVRTDPDAYVVAAAAKALGTVAAPLPAGDPRRGEVREALRARFGGGPWSASVGCLEGLGRLGGADGAEALAAVASDVSVDPRLRDIAVSDLENAGEAAIPHLFRLVFDQSRLGGTSDEQAERICDRAAETLDRLLDGRFGRSSAGRTEDREALLEAMRAEAKKRGHVR